MVSETEDPVEEHTGQGGAKRERGEVRRLTYQPLIRAEIDQRCPEYPRFQSTDGVTFQVAVHGPRFDAYFAKDLLVAPHHFFVLLHTFFPFVPSRPVVLSMRFKRILYVRGLFPRARA